MNAEALDAIYLTEKEYLELEANSPVKHEYLDGFVYAMGGGTLSHDILQNNLAEILPAQLRPAGCRAFGPDYAVRLTAEGNKDTRYYYPDKIISCDATDWRSTWMERPGVIFEILSGSTRQVDGREKRAAYLKLPSLQAYIRIEQDEPLVIVEFRTGEGWHQALVQGLDAVISLEKPAIRIPMAELYRDVPLLRD
jgi:Uma2 family endonuclease